MSTKLNGRGVVAIIFGATDGGQVNVLRFSEQEGCTKLMSGIQIPWLVHGKGKYWPLNWLRNFLGKVCGLAQNGDIICGAMWGADIRLRLHNEITIGNETVTDLARFYGSIPKNVLNNFSPTQKEVIYLGCGGANVDFYQPYAHIIAAINDGIVNTTVNIRSLTPMADVMTDMLRGLDTEALIYDQTMLQSMGLMANGAQNVYANLFSPYFARRIFETWQLTGIGCGKEIVYQGKKLFLMPFTHDSVPARLASQCVQVLWGGTWYGTAVQIRNHNLIPTVELHRAGIAIEGIGDEAFAIGNMGEYGKDWKRLVNRYFGDQYAEIADLAKSVLLADRELEPYPVASLGKDNSAEGLISIYQETFSSAQCVVPVAAAIVKAVAIRCREQIQTTCRLLGQPTANQLVITGGPVENVALQLALEQQGFVLSQSKVPGKETHYGTAARAMVAAGWCQSFDEALGVLANL